MKFNRKGSEKAEEQEKLSTKLETGCKRISGNKYAFDQKFLDT